MAERDIRPIEKAVAEVVNASGTMLDSDTVGQILEEAGNLSDAQRVRQGVLEALNVISAI